MMAFILCCLVMGKPHSVCVCGVFCPWQHRFGMLPNIGGDITEYRVVLGGGPYRVLGKSNLKFDKRCTSIMEMLFPFTLRVILYVFSFWGSKKSKCKVGGRF